MQIMFAGDCQNSSTRTIAHSMKTIGLFIGVIVLAVVLGLWLANILQDQKRQRARDEIARDVLAGMNTVKVGDFVSDHVFEDITGAPVRLSEVVGAGAIMCFVDPTCESCVKELELIRDIVPDPICCAPYLASVF
ncbi:MAG: hypothetical protein AB1644_06625 [Candidatus Zixiibacteriota bacterium]